MSSQFKTDSETCALVLAAGKGTRMKSDKPKVLHTLLGEPMLGYVLRALGSIFDDRVFIVVGHGADEVRAAYPHIHDERFVLQQEQKGTGHALQVAREKIKAEGFNRVLVINGDTPLTDTRSIEVLGAAAGQDDADLAFLTLSLEDPGNFGRVVRDASGRVAAVVEAKDYDSSVHGPETGEINAGVYLIDMEAVEDLLANLSDDNAGGEYYITDLIGMAVDEGLTVSGVSAGNDPLLLGINSPLELAAAEEMIRAEIVRRWLERGVVVHAPGSVRIGPGVVLDPDTEITGPTEIYGDSSTGPGSVIASHVIISDSRIGPGSEIRSFSHLDNAEVGEDCQVGPYARLRPGAVMERESRVGNFVEMKKAVLGPGAKANHLSYIGDAEVGAGSNIGAGTITCNYDGKKKHKTVIGEDSFIGSNTALVAPVTLGARSLIGAGSVITKNVDEDALAVTRPKQIQRSRKPSS
jgi:bifunctional UDP-N-acetylglucosamine pyrophosphorylase/glucosamine-1-phosphate N-acetyltransferase